MPRAKRGFKARRRRNRVLKQAKGFYSGRSRLIRTATEAVDNAHKAAFVGRKLKKRDYRKLWQVRIGAAAKELGTSYSRFLGSLKAKRVALDRKMLAELAVSHPADFKAVVEFVSRA